MINDLGRVADGEQALPPTAPEPAIGLRPSGNDPSRDVPGPALQAAIDKTVKAINAAFPKGKRYPARLKVQDRLRALTDKREYLLLASYCGNDNPRCNDRRPCGDCLAMCNVFRVADNEPEFLRGLGEPYASAIEARRAATLGAVHESAVAKPDAHTGASS